MIEVSAYVLNIENCDHSVIEDNQSLLPASSIKQLSDFTNSKVKIQSFVGEILARYAISEHFDVPYILSDFSFAARGRNHFLAITKDIILIFLILNGSLVRFQMSMLE